MAKLVTTRTPSYSECIPTNARSFLAWLLEALGVETAEEGSNLAKVTTGTSFPSDTEGRDVNVHFLRDSTNNIVAIQGYASGRQVTFDRRVVGEMRYLPKGTSIPGWVPADGTDGSLNLKDEAPDVYSPHPDGLLIAHIYVGPR